MYFQNATFWDLSAISSTTCAKQSLATADSFGSVYYHQSHISMVIQRGKSPFLIKMLMSKQASTMGIKRTLALTNPCSPVRHQSDCCRLGALIFLWNTACVETRWVLGAVKIAARQLGRWKSLVVPSEEDTTHHHHHHHRCHTATFTVGEDTLSMESQIIHQHNAWCVFMCSHFLSFHLYSCPSQHTECLQSHCVLSTALRELKCTSLVCVRAQGAVITLIKIIQLLSDRLIYGPTGFSQIFPSSERYFSLLVVYVWH